jgi:hypothetical protein
LALICPSMGLLSVFCPSACLLRPSPRIRSSPTDMSTRGEGPPVPSCSTAGTRGGTTTGIGWSNRTTSNGSSSSRTKRLGWPGTAATDDAGAGLVGDGAATLSTGVWEPARTRMLTRRAVVASTSGPSSRSDLLPSSYATPCEEGFQGPAGRYRPAYLHLRERGLFASSWAGARYSTRNRTGGLVGT